MKQYQKTFLIWLAFCVFVVSVWTFFGQRTARSMDRPFSDIISSLEKGEIKEITIIGNDFAGEMTNGTRFRSTGDKGSMVMNILKEANKKFQTKYKFEREETGSIWIFVIQWLPTILIMGLLFIFMRQMQTGGGRALSFGKSKARLLHESQIKITFDDVAGVDECKQELEEIVQFLRDPRRFTKLGGRIPKGVLLMGPPGTGKTLLAKAIAGEAKVPFFSIAGSDFVEMFVGVGASRVRDLFEQGKRNAPCIIFIDEIDAVGRQRGAGMGGGHDEREQTLNQLLVEMDGFEANEGVIIIAATNRPDVLDPAILRPGRFDRRIVVPRPDLLGREEIFKVHTKRILLNRDVNIEILARSTPGMSGADIENLVNEAALTAARRYGDDVKMVDFETAREKVVMGPERRTMVMSQRDIENTAYHEAGHALVSILIGNNVDPIHKVTIVPRGMALGVTMQLPTEDRYCITKTYAENQIAIMMGGRVAEELIFGELTSGAGNDFERASEVARRMVCEWGMSDVVGPLVYGKRNGEIFLGRDFIQTPDYSEKTSQEIDAEIKKIIAEQYKRAHDILEVHVEILQKVAIALLDYETLDGIEIKRILVGEKITKDLPAIKIKTREALDLERRKGAFRTIS